MNRLPWQSVLLVLAAGCTPAAEPVSETGVPHAARISSRPKVIDLGSLGGTTSFATDINDAGIAVGYSETAAGQFRAFRWTATEGMTALAMMPGAQRSSAIRILSTGEILGSMLTAGGRWLPVQWSPSGQVEALPIPRIAETYGMFPADFNRRGEVVGWALRYFEHGWYWSRQTGTIDLRERVPSCFENAASAINASGLVAGSHCGGVSSWLNPFTWSLEQGYRSLDVGTDIHRANAVGIDLNDAGTVTGWLDRRGNTLPKATIWGTDLKFTVLPHLEADFPSGVANGINNQGVIVGATEEGASNSYVPVAWPTPTTLLRLDAGGMQVAIAGAISDAGLIVGWGVDDAGVVRALLWKLSDGETVTQVISGEVVNAMEGEAPVRAPRTGPAACLEDRQAIRSRAALAECVMRAAGGTP